MYEARCDADEKHGRECFQRKMGTQMQEGEAKERAVAEGVKYADRDAAAYEKRCALEPAEAVERAAKTARREEVAAIIAAREAERWRVEEAARAAAVPGRIARGELVVARYVEVSGGVSPVLREVDVGSDAKVIREMGMGCVEHEGALYVEAKNAYTCKDAGTRVVAKTGEARVSAIAGRIARGELMLVKCVETEGGLREVDAQTAASEFREAGVWCVEHEGRLYVETGNAHEVSEGGTRVVEPAAGGWAAAK